MTERPIEVSVVLPCLNEEQTVPICVRKALGSFARLGIAGEVLVVDNGSTDRSAEVAAKAGARVVRHDLRGYGSALKRGIEEAAGTYVIMGDADDTYDFGDIEELVKRVRGGADLVMGSRLKGTIQPKAMPWLHRHIGTPVLTWILNRFFHAGISDANCGLRAFRKEAIQGLDLRCRGMEFASEMVVKAAQHGLRIAETPIPYYASRRDRTPHLRTFKDGWRHLRFMLLLCPKYLFVVPGAILFLAGLALMVLLMLRPVMIFGIPMGLSAGMFAGALMFIGLQIALFGVFAAIYYSSTGLVREDRLSAFLRRHFTLERGLAAGAVTLAGGIVLGLVTIRRLAAVARVGPYADIAATRLSILSIFVVLLGVQIIFFSFCLSLLDLHNRR